MSPEYKIMALAQDTYTAEDILYAVSKSLGIDKSEIIGTSRKIEIKEARFITSYLIKKHVPLYIMASWI